MTPDIKMFAIFAYLWNGNQLVAYPLVIVGVGVIWSIWVNVVSQNSFDFILDDNHKSETLVSGFEIE